MRPRRRSMPTRSERIRERMTTSSESSSIGICTRRPSLVTTTATRRRSRPLEVRKVGAVYVAFPRRATTPKVPANSGAPSTSDRASAIPAFIGAPVRPVCPQFEPSLSSHGLQVQMGTPRGGSLCEERSRRSRTVQFRTHVVLGPDWPSVPNPDGNRRGTLSECSDEPAMRLGEAARGELSR